MAAAACSAGAHISRAQLIMCVIGFVGFTILAFGAVSDYWTTYGITADFSGPRPSNETTSSSTALLSREGLWRVCLQYVAHNTTTVTGFMCYFGISPPESMSNGESTTRYEVAYLAATWVLFGVGVVLALVGVVMAMAALRQKKNQSLIRGVAAVFFFSVVLSFLGLVIYAVRTSKFPDQWSEGNSPYSSASLSWSYAISWVGIPLCLVAGVGHLWVVRRFEDTMI